MVTFRAFGVVGQALGNHSVVVMTCDQVMGLVEFDRDLYAVT